MSPKVDSCKQESSRTAGSWILTLLLLSGAEQMVRGVITSYHSTVVVNNTTRTVEMTWSSYPCPMYRFYMAFEYGTSLDNCGSIENRITLCSYLSWRDQCNEHNISIVWYYGTITFILSDFQRNISGYYAIRELQSRHTSDAIHVVWERGPFNTTLRSTPLTLICTSDGYPAPHLFAFYLNGKLLTTNENGILQKNITEFYSGNYSCEATNRLGSGFSNELFVGVEKDDSRPVQTCSCAEERTSETDGCSAAVGCLCAVIIALLIIITVLVLKLRKVQPRSEENNHTREMEMYENVEPQPKYDSTPAEYTDVTPVAGTSKNTEAQANCYVSETHANSYMSLQPQVVHEYAGLKPRPRVNQDPVTG